MAFRKDVILIVLFLIKLLLIVIFGENILDQLLILIARAYLVTVSGHRANLYVSRFFESCLTRMLPYLLLDIFFWNQISELFLYVLKSLVLIITSTCYGSGGLQGKILESCWRCMHVYARAELRGCCTSWFEDVLILCLKRKLSLRTKRDKLNKCRD